MLGTLRFHADHRFTQRHASNYLDGELDRGGLARVARHAGRCPECRRMLATLRRAVTGLMGLRTDQPTDLADSVIRRLRAEGEP
jgi:anti-sigma factor RsiW